MSFWSTIKSALGIERAPGERVLPPLDVTPGAEARLAALEPGWGARVVLQPAPAGWLTCVAEGPLPDGGHPLLGGLPVAVGEEDLERLRGLVLDHDGERWRVLAELHLRAKDTPNPNGRLYLVDRPLAYGRAFYGPGAERPPWLVRQLLGRDDVRSVLVNDASLTVERAPDVDWAPIDAAVGAAVREHVLSAGAPIVAEEATAHDGELAQAIAALLEREIAPAIHRDGGDVHLVDVHAGLVRVRLVGACRTCPAAVLTLKGGIEKTLKAAFPGEIECVEAVD